MKNVLFMIAAALFISVGTYAQDAIHSAQPGVQYGKAISADAAINIERLEAHLETDTAYVGKITGEVTSVCKKKGCFVEIKREGDEAPIMVRFKDYGFFMPQDIVGRTVVLEGRAWIKETSVDALKHYAEDQGKSEAEIAQITEPREDIAILADGVVVVR